MAVLLEVAILLGVFVFDALRRLARRDITILKMCEWRCVFGNVRADERECYGDCERVEQWKVLAGHWPTLVGAQSLRTLGDFAERALILDTPTSSSSASYISIFTLSSSRSARRTSSRSRLPTRASTSTSPPARTALSTSSATSFANSSSGISGIERRL